MAIMVERIFGNLSERKAPVVRYHSMAALTILWVAAPPIPAFLTLMPKRHYPVLLSLIMGMIIIQIEPENNNNAGF